MVIYQTKLDTYKEAKKKSGGPEKCTVQQLRSYDQPMVIPEKRASTKGMGIIYQNIFLSH